MSDSLPSDNGSSVPPESQNAAGANGLQNGLEVLGKALASIVQAAKDAIGPELMRNLAAGQLFQQIAVSLDEAAAGIEATGTCPPAPRGQLSLYLDRLAAEIKGSKFEEQGVNLQGRLEKTLRLLSEANSPSAANAVKEAAGYFHAAAASAMPVAGSEPVTFEAKV